MSRSRRGFLSSTLSIDSTVSTIPDESLDSNLPNPTSLADCEDEIETLETLLESKTNQLDVKYQEFKKYRRSKEPLIQMKEELQREITTSITMINKKSEELTQLKHKLRHHSESQIQNNIERLELQLRVNNYKPREEQKILDEISMLQRSSKALKEYNIKQVENRKFREERELLIRQRNSVYDEIHAIKLHEDEIRKTISELKKLVAVSRRNLDHLKTLKPNLEKALENVKTIETPIIKKEEKLRPKRESIRKFDDKRRKRKDSEVIKAPYEDEIKLCLKLLSYLESLLPSAKEPQPALTTAKETSMTRTQSEPLFLKDAKNVPETKSSTPFQQMQGTFYIKPKPEDDGFGAVRRKSRKGKSKDQKSTKSIPHPPDVLVDFIDLAINVPKDLDQAGLSLVILREKLDKFQKLAEEELNKASGYSVVQEPSQSAHKEVTPSEPQDEKVDTISKTRDATSITNGNTHILSNETLANILVEEVEQLQTESVQCSSDSVDLIERNLPITKSPPIADLVTHV